MWVTNITVRYAETDMMGVVHHANYPIWFEMGRTEYIKETGISYSEIESRGAMLPLIHLECTYKRPAKYEDILTVVTRLVELSCVKVRFAYEVYNTADNTLLATGETTHAWTNRELRPINFQRKEPEVYKLLSDRLEEQAKS